MQLSKRDKQIVSKVNADGFASVKELSQFCDVSEVTIRRDLVRLDKKNLVRRTYGGAASLSPARPTARAEPLVEAVPENEFLTHDVDVMIASSIDPHADEIVLSRLSDQNIPIIAESVGMQGVRTTVAVDDFQASLELGGWVGNYVNEHFFGTAYVLDLNYHLENTRARSRGFIKGLKGKVPETEIVLSINAQSTWQTAYQVTYDALNVHPQINVIFAINDATAWGAIRACEDVGVSTDKVMVVPFGLEGKTMRRALLENTYCKVAIAHFPEIIAFVIVEAALHSFAASPIPKRLVTPHAILTGETLSDFYKEAASGWTLDWDAVHERLDVPLMGSGASFATELEIRPKLFGLIIPHVEHEFYEQLSNSMQAYLAEMGIMLKIFDVAQNLRDEVTRRKRKIAQQAVAKFVQNNDVCLIDHGQINTFVAELLVDTPLENVTVITNSIEIFEILNNNEQITLILTGGVYNANTRTLVGPTVVNALKELRADKLFLAIEGVSFDFGLSHTSLEEVSIKRAMIEAAREVILLADHTKFGLESVIQVSPLTAINRVITDNGLPASSRLELAKSGIQITLG